MNTVWQFFQKPDVWIGLGIGIVATWAAGSLPKLLKNVLLWGPKRFGRGLVGLLKEAFYVSRASKDATGAALFVAHNLALLIINVAMILALLVTIATYQILDPRWASAPHAWVVRFASLLILIFSYGILKRLFLIALAYTAFFDPPKEATTLKIGKFEFNVPPKATSLPSKPQLTAQPEQTPPSDS